MVVEYHHRDDSYFLSSSNPQDFIIDLRELFLTYNKSNYELRLGKQIYSWGSVDENSPLDIVSGLDYYYLFFGGTEKKLASLSIALDYYIKNIKMQFYHTAGSQFWIFLKMPISRCMIKKAILL